MPGIVPGRLNVSITDHDTIELILLYHEQLGTSTSYAAIVGQAMRRKLPPLERGTK